MPATSAVGREDCHKWYVLLNVIVVGYGNLWGIHGITRLRVYRTVPRAREVPALLMQLDVY
jgi:hypothetical protein